MKYLIITLIIFFNFFSNSFSQKKLLNNPVALSQAKIVLDACYGMEIEKASDGLSELKTSFPNHPVISFLEAFLIYWEYFPLYPDHPKAEEFIFLMEDCIVESEEWLKNSDEMEAQFFDLFGRAFFIMFWADNGKSAKVFPHINTLYHHTLEGFDIMNEFNEYYFTTGLYNYYIEAYSEKHPVYKPIVRFFRDGNEDLGLEQLKYCAENATFLRVDSKLFLSLIYLNYENNIDSASIYAAQLYNEFPNNTYYAGRYLEILLLNKKYFFAPIVLKHLKNAKGDFASMQYDLFMAAFLEKKEKKYEEAIFLYKKALSSSMSFGPVTEKYTALAYMGLGRVEVLKGNYGKSKKYFREAKRNTSYDYILEDR